MRRIPEAPSSSSASGRHPISMANTRCLAASSKASRCSKSSNAATRTEKNPPEPDKIVKAEVLRDRGHEYLPHKVE